MAFGLWMTYHGLTTQLGYFAVIDLNISKITHPLGEIFLKDLRSHSKKQACFIAANLFEITSQIVYNKDRKRANIL